MFNEGRFSTTKARKRQTSRISSLSERIGKALSNVCNAAVTAGRVTRATKLSCAVLCCHVIRKLLVHSVTQFLFCYPAPESPLALLYFATAGDAMDSAISPLAQKISDAIDAIQTGNAQAVQLNAPTSPSIADISSSITNQANTIKSTVSSIKSTWKATSKKVRTPL